MCAEHQIKNRTGKTVRRLAAYMLAAFMILSVSGFAGAQETAAAEENGVPQESTEGAEELTGNYNLLLIGSDRRDTSWNGNSDVMLLVTINHDVDKIFLTSFMRDLWADIPGVGQTKLNAAYASGGASLLEETLKNCYRIHVDNYAAVDFDGIANIIDLMGGVKVKLDTAEADFINQGVGGSDVRAGASVLLNGKQACMHMRNRSTRGSDFERTRRQREVLVSLFNSISASKLLSIQENEKEYLDQMETDLKRADIMKLILQFPTFSSYRLVQERLPYDHMYHSENEVLVPDDLNATVKKLTDEIYAAN